ncbi:unnamed protein product [Hydatigera taeniaeformis]|uniref:Transmembrane protein 107 n=1 Tax=Hydatigena taeniaeformis TaxID=6205 RepID=A0A0R3WZT5_HYDTA|nr:unnamed protein product [Hydatigera taeniaeformis]
MGSMLESIFFVITTLFSLLFLILAVSIESWPCGGVFANSCQVNLKNYPILPIGVLICISIILYAIAACMDLAQIYLHQLNDRVRHIVAYVALGTSVVSSLFVVSAMLAFFNLYMGSWSIMLSVVGMTLGCSITFQLGMRILFDLLGKNVDSH